MTIYITNVKILEIARDYLNDDERFEVIGGFISPVSDGYAKKDLAPASHRCRMAELAVRGSDWICGRQLGIFFVPLYDYSLSARSHSASD